MWVNIRELGREAVGCSGKVQAWSCFIPVSSAGTCKTECLLGNAPPRLLKCHWIGGGFKEVGERERCKVIVPSYIPEILVLKTRMRPVFTLLCRARVCFDKSHMSPNAFLNLPS